MHAHLRLRAASLTLIAVIFVSLLGCSNEDGTVHEVADGYKIDSGLAQKGPLIRGSLVTINSLSASTLKPTGASYNFQTNNNLGAFDPSGTVFTSQLIETTASGYYFNESTARVSKDIVMLRGISDLSSDRAVNINVLTQIANSRTRQLFTTKAEKTFAAARARAQRELLSTFYIYNSADLMPSTGVVRSFSELDLSKARAADQILAAISAQIAEVGVDGSGISVLLSDLEADLANDGLLNNSGGLTVSPVTTLRSVWGNVSWAQIAANLNGFYSNTAYKATDLSQWVDSSGGLDQVIDKFKFSSIGAVGTPIQSPAYVAGVDDVGQCFSVSAGKLYRNGVAVSQASVRAVKGDSFKIELIPSASGPLNGFIERGASLVNSTCPTSLPNVGLIRLQKYTVTPTVITTYSVGGSVSGLSSGQSVTLVNRGDNPITLSTNGPFTFSAQLALGSPYFVTIRQQPKGQNCVVLSGTGTVSGTITNIAITCGAYSASTLSTFAGSGQAGMTNGTGRAARFNNPQGIALDASGNVYISDTGNNMIRKISPLGVVTTYAGSGQSGNGDGLPGQPLTAQFNQPRGIAIDTVGNLYIADSANNLIRKISTLGVVSTLAGNGNPGYTDSLPSSVNGGAVTFDNPTGVAVDVSGNVYVADRNNGVIRKILPTGFTSTLAGSGHNGGADGFGISADFFYPLDLTLDKTGDLFVADQGNPTVRRVSIATGKVTTVMNGYTYNAQSGQGITTSLSGNIYLYSVCALYRLTPDGKGGLTTSSPGIDSRYEHITGDYAGCGYIDSALAVGGKINGGASVIDAQGNLIFADSGNNVIRIISSVDMAPTTNQYQRSIQ
jgi:hypothetical protein